MIHLEAVIGLTRHRKAACPLQPHTTHLDHRIGVYLASWDQHEAGARLFLFLKAEATAYGDICS